MRAGPISPQVDACKAVQKIKLHLSHAAQPLGSRGSTKRPVGGFGPATRSTERGRVPPSTSQGSITDLRSSGVGNDRVGRPNEVRYVCGVLRPSQEGKLMPRAAGQEAGRLLEVA